jgi:hypothetical protein
VRTLARAAISSLLALSIGLTIVVVAVAAIGVIGTRASTRLGNSIASDELATSAATVRLARDMDSAYVTGEEAFLTPEPAQQSRLLGLIYTGLLSAIDTELSYLGQLHAHDSPAERADMRNFAGQWAVVRTLLSPANVTAHPATTLASRLTAAYQPVSAHLDRLFQKEQRDGHGNRVAASANAGRTTAFVIGAAIIGIMIGVLLLLSGIRRIRRNLAPGQYQKEFADTLQLANDEEEAHQLLQHHLERTLAATTAVVLNRNNSADRLEAVTPLLDGSPLAGTLRGAEPRSCLAVRSGRTHRERSILRTRDFAGRNGGEEFAVLLPDTDIHAGLEIAERIRAAIAEISLPGSDVSVTASIGAGGFPNHASTLDRLERLADAALYLAKRHGRNRVELAEPSAVEATAGLPEPAAQPVPS